MSKQTEALKLALEASEVLEALFKQAEAMHKDMTAGVNVHCQITVADLSKGLYAAAATREALAEQPACEHEWLRGGCLKCGQSIEQPAQQQELCPSCKNGDIYACTCTFKSAQQQESVGEIGKIVMFGGDLKEVSWKNGKMPPVGSALYTSPPASKPLVGLTDEQVRQGGRKADPGGEDLCTWSFKQGVRFAEAAHGIKGDA